MLRGLLTGGFWGALIGGIALALTSQLADWRDLTPALTEEATEDAPAPSVSDGANGTPDTPVVVAGADIDRPQAVEAPLRAAGSAPSIAPPAVELAPPDAPQPNKLPTSVAAPVAPAPESGSVEIATVAAPPTAGEVRPSVAAPATDALPMETETATALTPARHAPSAQAEIGTASAPSTLSDPPAAPADLSGAAPAEFQRDLAALGAPGADPLPSPSEAPLAPQPLAAGEILAEAQPPVSVDEEAVAPAPSSFAPQVLTEAPSAGIAPVASDAWPTEPEAPESPVADVALADVPSPQAPTVEEALPAETDRLAEADAPESAEAPQGGELGLAGVDAPPAAGAAPAAPVARAPEVKADAPEPEAGPEVVAADSAPLVPSVEERAGPASVAPPVVSATAPDPVAEAVVEEAAAPEAEPQEVAVAEPRESATRPRINRIGSGGSAMPGVRVRRLPGIDGDSETDPEVPTNAAIAADSSAPAIERNAIPFERPADTALISVVLVHEPGSEILDTPVPMTFAVAASSGEAGRLASAYREAGHEVALIPDLPPRPSAQDVEVALAVNLETVQGAVAILDPDGAGFDANRDATAQAVAAARGSGHGILTKGQGFNSAARVAGQVGVPAAEILRQIDPALSDRVAIGRALDQAAMRARTEGEIVVLARASEAQIAGILAWALENRGSGVALAPLSTVLQAE